MRNLLAFCAALVLAQISPAVAGTSVSVGLRIGDAPPPPVVVYERAPHFEYIPSQRVYVIDDDNFGYDYFRYGGVYYMYNDGWWYRSSRYRGPFVAVQVSSVPRAIFAISDRDYRWRHHPHGMPPGQAKKYGYSKGHHGKH